VKIIVKYLPGLIGGGIVAMFFQDDNAQGYILAFLFAALITLVIALAAELKISDRRVTDLEDKLIKFAEVTSMNFENLSKATDDDLQSLAEQMGTEIHELALLIADKTFGEEE
jgi:hypothetical protein